MTGPPPLPKRPAPWPFLNPYAILCLAALGVIALLEMQRGLRLVAPIVLLIGLLGVLTRMRAAPLLLLVTFAAVHLEEQHRLFGFGWDEQELPWRRRTFRATDVALCAAMLAYFVGHYRLQAVGSYLFPPDPRLRDGSPGRAGRVVQMKRSPRLVTTDEVGWLVLTLPVPALLGQLAWMALARPWNVLGLPLPVGRLLLLFWVLAIAAFVVAALLGHWRSRQMTAEEGTLFLQDTLWRETRGEQRRINRWLGWSRVRRRRKERP